MKVENIDVNETLEKARAALKKEKNISSSTKLIFELLITLIVILINRLGLNSKIVASHHQQTLIKQIRKTIKEEAITKRKEVKMDTKVQPLSQLMILMKLRS